VTTAAEIRKWTRAIASSRDDVVLRGRFLFMIPIRHVIRGVAFPGSWDKTLPRPYWFVATTVTPPAGSFGGKWRGNLDVGRSNEPGFSEILDFHLNRAIEEELAPLETIEAFYAAAATRNRPAPVHGNWERLQHFPANHAAVLAALGRLEEAGSEASAFVDKYELLWQQRLLTGEAMMASRRTRGMGRDEVEFASHQLALVDYAKSLASLAASGKKAEVVSLLRDWERTNIHRWKLELAWEPTPFPLERDL
jgi:hypothetical protein